MEKSKPRLTTAFTRHQKSRALSASRLSSPILKPAVSFPHAALLGDVGGNGTAITAAGLPSVANSNVALQVQAAQSTALSTGASQTEGLNPVGSTPDGQVLHLDTSGWQAVLASQAGRLRPGQSLLVRTNPASLGPIQVEAVHSGQGKHFHIQLTANHSDTIRMLQQGAPLIAQQISGVGTNTITQITVSDAATFSQAFFSSSQENSRQPNKDGTPTQTRRLSTGLVENVQQKVGDSSIVQDVTGFESWI
ncbi:hypothetical protein A6M23_10305 [Acidithiobacillus thiooxidans]|uniref:Flagellar hook-length control protein-like C-terminal domain-containing protein n=2 Tax=Acidithiobacillus thiooxidans TaxID=930 RepID=A0A1C2I8B3_ACITH|nr:hypothetical protein A6M23_10305 [Acidithiobacillus thiooxidans]OCX79228.1 hypothetical protein A6P08_18250 [Acidithiobacillus thiooxidans]